MSHGHLCQGVYQLALMCDKLARFKCYSSVKKFSNKLCVNLTLRPIFLQNLRQYLDGNIWSIFSVHHPNIDQILLSVVFVTRAHYMRVIKNICAASRSIGVYRCTKKSCSVQEHSIIKGILKSEQKPLAYHLV